MRFSVVAAMVLFGVLTLFSGQSFAGELVWYDAEKKALAIDTYADGYGGIIEFDFNEDHSGAGIIQQGLWTSVEGSVTNLGVYSVTFYDSGGWSMRFGWHGSWGNRLGTNFPAYDFSTEVTTLYSGALAPDGFHYFTPSWDVDLGRTVIYVQPIVNSQVVPVTESNLATVHYRRGYWFSGGDWLQFDGTVVPPDPAPVPEPDPGCGDDDGAGGGDAGGGDDTEDSIAAQLTVSPSVLNSKSSGLWVTAKIELPETYDVNDVDVDSVEVSIVEETTVDDSPAETIAVVRRLGKDGKNKNKLIVKFDRSELMELLEPGETEVYAHGKLNDGKTFSGSTTLELSY